MSCGITDPVACVTEAVQEVAGNIGGAILTSLADAFKAAAEWCIKEFMTAWLKSPSPDIDSSASVVGWLQSHLWFITLAVSMGAMLIAAYRLATTQQWQHGRELAEALVRLVIVTTTASFLISTGIKAGDAYTEWILDVSKIDLSQTIALGILTQPGVLLIMAIIVILAQIIQFFIMLARNGMLIYLAGALPTLSANTNTTMGKQSFQKAVAWTIAFVLYKPVAATIYAGAFQMVGKDQDLTTQLSGIAMMILAIVSLPALMRLLVPATAAMSGGNAGAMAGAIVGAVVATGAIAATGGAAAPAAAGAGFGGGGAAAAGGGAAASAGSGSAAAGGGGGAAATAPVGAASSGEGAAAGGGATSPAASGSGSSTGEGSGGLGGESGNGPTGAGEGPTGAESGGSEGPPHAPPVSASELNGGGQSATGSTGGSKVDWRDASAAMQTGIDLAQSAEDGANGAVGEG